MSGDCDRQDEHGNVDHNNVPAVDGVDTTLPPDTSEVTSAVPDVPSRQPRCDVDLTKDATESERGVITPNDAVTPCVRSKK